MNVSIASYSFHGLLGEGVIDLFGYLESCRYRYQVRTADIWDGMLVSTEDGYLAKVKQALDERELTLVNLCVDKADIWADDPHERERNYQNALAHLRAAEVLGAKTIRINSAVKGVAFTNEQFDWVVKRFKEYAQRAYDHGFKAGPENHWGAENIPENMQRICQAVDHPGFGMLLHFKGIKGDTIMAPWAMHTHISWDTTMNNLDESVTMLRNAGYQGCWGVEHHSGKNEYARVAVQLAMLRNVLSAG